MKVLGKVMMGASVGALALAVFSGVDADAAGFSKDKKITGLVAGDAVSFDAVKATKNGLQYNAKAKWDLYEKGCDADISNVNTKSKDVYITVKTASGTDVYKIAKDTKRKFKAACDGSKIAIEVDKAAVSDTDIVNYSWRTATSNWTAFTAQNVDLTPYTMQGATIYIRYTGATAISPAAGSEKVTIDGTEVTVKDIATDSFSKAEFKVKVPKKANAPAITVDYTKGVIKKNAKAVYTTNAALTGALTALATATDKLESDFTIDNKTAGTFVMQIPADTAKKKPASKIAFFSWKADTAPTVTYTAPSYSGSTLTGSKTGELITGKLAYTAEENAKADKAKFIIENKTTGDAAVTYELFNGDKKVAAIAPEKKFTLVGSNKNVPNNTELSIRVAGDKKKLTLPGQFATQKVKVVYLETPKEESAS